MIRRFFPGLVLLILIVPVLAYAYWETGHPAEVRVFSDNGVEFAKYRTYPRVSQKGTYFYMEAVKGERYSIEVSNTSDKRIGVVVAVDGRNIISGEKSDLKPTERMYIISPHQTSTFEGWRTGMDRTNRFYFTDQSDSYAEKVFSDGSAMGTIAVVVYKEKVRPTPVRPETFTRMKETPSGTPRSSLKGSPADRAVSEKREQAGTGFGETTYSPARITEFEAERTMAGKIVLKYEWQKELCRKGIASCGPRNRFWPDNNGFAPVPHGFRG